MNRENLQRRIGRLEAYVADPVTILDVVRAQLDLAEGVPGVTAEQVDDLLRRVKMPRMTPALRRFLEEADDKI